MNEAFRIKFFLEQFGIRPLIFAPSLPLDYRQQQISKFNLGASDVLVVCSEASQDEAGVIRGIDFENVDVVLNFSFPQTIEDLQHIAGRAGRGTNGQGLCINLIIDIDEATCTSSNLKYEYQLQNQLLMECIARKIEFIEQKLDMDKLRTDFGYRVKDIFTQMTDSNIKKYRVEQLKMLAMNSR